MKNTIYLIGFLWIYTLISCIPERQFSDTPVIEFKSLSKNTLLQGELQEDTVYVTIGFKDGDGDIGDNQNLRLTIKDTRLESQVPAQFLIPELPELGAQEGIEGTMKIALYSTCCFQGSSRCQAFENMPTQEVVYSIQIMDNAGNESNVILTDPIQLLCQ